MNFINTNANAQYNIAPFERKEIIIGAIGGGPNRAAGQLVPELEGTGFYVERCDYPVLVNIGHGMGGLESSINLRDGLEIDAPFKGLTFTHPVINVASKVTLILLKNGARITNNLDNPVARMQVAYRVIVNTAVQYTVGVYVYPGSRSLKNLEITTVDTTVTAVTAQFFDAGASPIIANTTFQQQFGPAAVVYAQGGGVIGPSAITSVVAGQNNYTFPNIFVPTNAVELQITLTGTGLTGGVVSGNYE